MGVAKLTDQNTIVPESKYARIERERKFLLDRLPDGLTPASRHMQITDNYLTGTRLRLRKVRDPQTNKWTLKLTQKFAPNPKDLSRTIITNVYLNAREYNMLAVFEANEIRKNRYPFEHQSCQYGIDVFIGALWGLMLAEISFETDEALEQSATPPFAIAEVTNNEMFTGAKLTELTFADIRGEISRGGLVSASANPRM
jgi:CYTH domain-containing protein